MFKKSALPIILSVLSSGFLFFSACSTPHYSPEAGRFMKGAYVKALKRGDYHTAINGLLSDIKRGEQQKDFILQVESAISLSSIYLYILRDYDRGIHFGKKANLLTDQVITRIETGKFRDLFPLSKCPKNLSLGNQSKNKYRRKSLLFIYLCRQPGKSRLLS